MAGKLVDDRPGDLTAFGQPTKEGYVESDASLDAAEGVVSDEGEATPVETQPVEEVFVPGAAESAEAPVEEQQEEVDPDVDPYDAILANVLTREQGGETEEEEFGPEGSESAYYRGKLEATEAALRQQQIQPEPDVAPVEEEEDDEVDYNHPAIQQALTEAAGDPAKMAQAIKVISEHEAERLTKRQVRPIQRKLDELEVRERDESQRVELRTKINAGMQAAYNLGGLEASIIKEAYQNSGQSLLFQYLQHHKSLAMSPEGIVTATMAVARAVEKAHEQNAGDSDKPVQSAPAPTLTAAPRQSTSSKRGEKLLTKEPPAEDDEKARIIAARDQSKSLPFMNF